MKRSTMFAIIAVVALVGTVLLGTFIAQRNETQNREEVIEEVAAEIEREIRESYTGYEEPGVDNDYNYIVDYGTMFDYYIPEVGLKRFGDNLDALLKSNGITGAKIFFDSVSEPGTELIAEAVIDKDSSVRIYLNYDYTNDTLNTYLKLED